jgi:hypothetical protein
MINKNIIYIIIIILIIGLFVVYRNINENFDTTSLNKSNNEAIQNISSIYNNSGTMVLPNLNITGKLTIGDWNLNDASGNLIITNKNINNNIIGISSNGVITTNGITASANNIITVSGNIQTSGNISASRYLFNSGWNISPDSSNNLNFSNNADLSSNGPLIFGSHLDKIYMPVPSGKHFGIYSGKPGNYNRFLFTANGFLIGQGIGSDNNTPIGITSYTVNNNNPFVNASFMQLKQ